MKVIEQATLSDYAHYQIGGIARVLILIERREEIIPALHYVRKHHIEQVLPLGLGSNILLPDTGFPGAVLLLRGTGSDIHLSGERKISAFAGDTVDALINKSFTEHLTGLEWAGGLPSSIGGAIRGNAGAFGSEIKDSVFTIEVIDMTDPNLEVKTFTNEQGDFSYRNSFFKQHPQYLITGGTFSLHQANEEGLAKAKEIYHANIAYRQKNHPVEYPSCGSVFKNITQKEKVETVLSVWPDVRELSENKWHNKVSMGYIINRLGFSGKQIGGAQVSPKHTNYIVNIDHATAADVRSLIEAIQEKFKEIFGFFPEPEVMLFEHHA